MAVVVATRTKMSRWRYLPRFMTQSLVVALQARRSPGFRGGRLRIGTDGSFWTLTAWNSGRDMVAFRESGRHAEVMPSMAGWASEALFAMWNDDGTAMPAWSDVSRRVAAKPNHLDLDAPSPAHLEGAAPSVTRAGLPIPIPRRRS